MVLAAVMMLVSSACNTTPPGGALAPTHSAAEREEILEIFYSTVEKMNDLILQIDAETNTYVALQSQVVPQGKSGDILGVATTFRRLESISLRSAGMTQQQIHLVDEALEECLPYELVELLELHREEAVLMQDAFEAEAKMHGLMAEQIERWLDDPDISEQLLPESWEAQEERIRLSDEAEVLDMRRVQREKEIFAGDPTPPRCD